MNLHNGEPLSPEVTQMILSHDRDAESAPAPELASTRQRQRNVEGPSKFLMK